MTRDGIDAIKRIRAKLPVKALRYINDFHERLDAGVTEDSRFEFRVHLVPQVGPKGDADMAVNFVQLGDVDPTTQEALERLGKTGLVVKQTKREPVQNMGKYKPHVVVEKVAAEVPGYSMANHIAAWKRHGVRPETGASDPAMTDARYSVWDEPHGDYLYTDAWVRKLIREERRALDPSVDDPAGADTERVSRR